MKIELALLLLYDLQVQRVPVGVLPVFLLLQNALLDPIRLPGSPFQVRWVLTVGHGIQVPAWIVGVSIAGDGHEDVAIGPSSILADDSLSWKPGHAPETLVVPFEVVFSAVGLTAFNCLAVSKTFLSNLDPG